jgi:hypothetical protein
MAQGALLLHGRLIPPAPAYRWVFANNKASIPRIFSNNFYPEK